MESIYHSMDNVVEMQHPNRIRSLYDKRACIRYAQIMMLYVSLKGITCEKEKIKKLLGTILAIDPK